MSIATAPTTERPTTDGGDHDELTHVSCCLDLDIALCGLDVSEANYVPEATADDLCVVCLDLVEPAICPRFGKCAA